MNMCDFAKRLCAVGLLAVLGCGPDAPKPSADSLDAHAADANLPACAGVAQLYGIGVDEQPFDLVDGSQLPVTQGFQGFLFVRVGLRTAMPLPGAVLLGLSVVLDNDVEVAVAPHPVKVSSAGGQAQTSFVALYFNDWPLPQLVGRKAKIKVAARTDSCVLSSEVAASLSLGAYMSADAAFWADVD